MDFLPCWYPQKNSSKPLSYSVDSEFIPYFDPNPPATTDMKDVYISMYKREDGCALLIVANSSKENRSETITLDAKRIGLSVSEVLTWPGKAP